MRSKAANLAKYAQIDEALAERPKGQSLREIARRLDVSADLVSRRSRVRRGLAHRQCGPETYFVYSPALDFVKIGKSSSNTGYRVYGLLSQSPDPGLSLVGVVSRDVEAHLHTKFGSSRAHFEWFKRTNEIVAFCDMIFGPRCFEKAWPIESQSIPKHLIVDWHYQGDLL